MRRKRSKKPVLLLSLVAFCVATFSIPKEISQIIEIVHFSRYRDGYREGFMAGAKSSFADGYNAGKEVRTQRRR